MKKKLLIFISLVLVVCAALSSAVIPASAANYKNDVKLKSQTALLINLDTGQTVYSVKANERRYPASTTKIMTYIVVAEHIKDFENTRIEIKQSVLNVLEGTGSSVANVASHVGESMRVIDLLYSMMVPSGNDAAVVLADYVGGGDTSKFVKMMNDKAKELGCKDTHFMNPDGLHDKNHYTTANDLAKMARYALTLPEFSTITNTATYYVEGEDYPLVTTNYMIDENRGGEYYYQYAQGIKTGTTDEAGHCLVTMGSADGYTYLGVFLMNPIKDPDEYGTMIDAADLFRWSLTQLELNQVASAETPICEAKVSLAWGKDSIQLTPEKNINAIVPTDYKQKNIIIEKSIPKTVEAPIKKGDVIGTATVYYKGSHASGKQKLATVNLVASESVERSGIIYVFEVVKKVVVHPVFLIMLGVIVLLIIIYIISSVIISKRRRKRSKHVRKYRNF